MEVDEEISEHEKKTEGRRYSSFISFRNGDFRKNEFFTAAFLYLDTVPMFFKLEFLYPIELVMNLIKFFGQSIC